MIIKNAQLISFHSHSIGNGFCIKYAQLYDVRWGIINFSRVQMAVKLVNVSQDVSAALLHFYCRHHLRCHVIKIQFQFYEERCWQQSLVFILFSHPNLK